MLKGRPRSLPLQSQDGSTYADQTRGGHSRSELIPPPASILCNNCELNEYSSCIMKDDILCNLFLHLLCEIIKSII